MIRKFVYFSLSLLVLLVIFSFVRFEPNEDYKGYYLSRIGSFENEQIRLLESINIANLNDTLQVEQIKSDLIALRRNTKGLDFWLRYLEPIAYKKINGPLPIEWETEVFEKFEKPYKREGAGYTLALQYLEEDKKTKVELVNLLSQSLMATKIYQADSIVHQLNSYHHFYLCNRLFLLNLAAIYTTGFDSPLKENVVPELLAMLNQVNDIYHHFNQSFPDYQLPENYLKDFQQAIKFVAQQPAHCDEFDHYNFIKKHINPLFGSNQTLIAMYKVKSTSQMDYSLNNSIASIFSKQLYNGQSSKGVFLRVYDEEVLEEIRKVGKLLFYDPLLSGNNMRSCASCHNPQQFFTDTNISTPVQFDRLNALPRNSPSLINASFQHLMMVDGKHTTLQKQATAVITSLVEMGGEEKEVLERVLNCKDYNSVFSNLLKYTPTLKTITIDHIVSSITFYYSDFSNYNSPFDDSMNGQHDLNEREIKGFNLFMGKANCATCHFVPQFNGVKPPYIGSEFEVIGVPEDLTYQKISSDLGRFLVHPANEMQNAFRTSTLRNIKFTKPYMHNGVFKSLDEVVEFYNRGGGVGFGLPINNQTLSADSLNLSDYEKHCLVDFMGTLTEAIEFQPKPKKLPKCSNPLLDNRKVGGIY